MSLGGNITIEKPIDRGVPNQEAVSNLEIQRLNALSIGLREVLSGSHEEVDRFQTYLIDSLGDTDLNVPDQSQKDERAIEYMKSAKTWLQASLSAQEMDQVKAFMRENKNNLGLLATALLFQEDEEKASFIRLMAGTLSKKATSEGISVEIATGNIAELIQAANIMGQRYPIFEAHEGRTSLLTCLEQSLSRWREESENVEIENEENKTSQRDKLQLEVLEKRPNMVKQHSQQEIIQEASYYIRDSESNRDVPLAQDSIEQIREGLWMIFDPDNGYYYSDLDPNQAGDRLKMINGAFNFLRPVVNDLSETEVDLLMLAITHPVFGIGSVSNESVGQYTNILGLAAELTQRDPKYRDLVQEYAVNSAEALMNDYHQAGEVINEEIYLWWQNVARLMTIGLNGADAEYLDRYFGFCNEFAGKSYGQEINPPRLDCSIFIPVKTRNSNYRDVYNEGYLANYRELYGDSFKGGKYPLLADQSPHKLPNEYIDGAIDYANNAFLEDAKTNKYGAFPDIFTGIVRNLLVFRSKELNLDSRNAQLIIQGLVDVLKKANWDQTRNIPKDEREFYVHCLEMICDDTEFIDTIKKDQYSLYLQTEVLEDILRKNKAKLEQRESLSRQINTGVDERIIIAAQFEELSEDEEYRRWVEGVREEFGRLREKAALSVDSMDASDNLYRDRFGTSFQSLSYMYKRYEELRGNDAIMMKTHKELNRLYGDSSEFSFDDMLGLLEESNQALSEEQFRNMFVYEQYSRPFFFLDHGNNFISEKEVNIILERLPKVRKFFEEVVQGLDNDHPVRKLMGACNASVEDIIREIDICENSLKQNQRLCGRNENIGKFQDVVSYLGTVIVTKAMIDEEEIELNRSDGYVEVVDGTSPRLESTIGRFAGNHNTIRRASSEVSPFSLRLEQGEICLVSGPTGSGKTAFIESFLQVARIAVEQGYTPAEAVILAREITSSIDVGSLEITEDRRLSLFKNSAVHEKEEIARRKVYGADEPAMGAPAEFRIPLAAAILAAQSYLGRYSVVASHQSTELVEVFEVLGIGDRVSPIMIDPFTHRSREGIAGSYGIDMIKMQGGDPIFIELMYSLQYAREQGYSEIDVSDILEQLVLKEGEEGEARGLDELTMESAELDKCMREIITTIIGKENSGIHLDRVMKYFSDTDESIEEDIEHFENLSLEEAKNYKEGLRKAIGLYHRNNSMVEASRKLSRFSSIDLSDPYSILKDDDFITANSLITEIVTPSDIVLSDEEAEAVDYLFVDGFRQSFSDSNTILQETSEMRPSEESVEDLIAEIENDELMEAFFSSIMEENLDKEGKKKYKRLLGENDKKGIVDLFFSTYFRNPKGFNWSDYQGDSNTRAKFFQLAFRDYLNEVKDKLNAQEGESDTPSIAFTEQFININTRRFIGLAVSQYKLETGSSDEGKFVKPEEDLTEAGVGASLAFQDGINLSLMSQLSERNEYVRQNYYYDETGAVRPSEKSKTTFLTGLQGGGKTEMLRLQLQLNIFLKYFNRVPASRATVLWRPDKIEGVIRRPTTVGKTSTFMGEAERLAKLVERIRKGTAVFYDEPANGTSDKDREVIIAALVALINARGGTFMATNHENGVYPLLNRMGYLSNIGFSTLGYTTEKREDYGFDYDTVAGAETLKVAQELGLPPELIELARFIHKTRRELYEHIDRIQNTDEE